jgi:hypothetical protein
LKSSTASSAKAEADLTRLVSERDAVNSKLATELTQANADFVRVSKSLDECMARCQALALDNDRLQTTVTQTRQTLESQLSELRAERDRLVAEANVRPVRTAMSSPDPAGSPLPSRTPSERDAGRIRRLTEQISQLQEWYTVSVLREFFDKEGMRAMYGSVSVFLCREWWRVCRDCVIMLYVGRLLEWICFSSLRGWDLKMSLCRGSSLDTATRHFLQNTWRTVIKLLLLM